MRFPPHAAFPVPIGFSLLLQARTAWSADGDATHRLQQATLGALRQRMGNEAYERYQVEKGRWVPL